MKILKKSISIILASFILAISIPLTAIKNVSASTDISQYGLDPNSTYAVDENEKFILAASMYNGSLDSDIYLVDKRTGYVWRSSPADLWKNDNFIESEKFKVGSSLLTDIAFSDGNIGVDTSLFESDLTSYQVRKTTSNDIYMEVTYSKTVITDIETKSFKIVVPMKISLEEDYMYAEILLSNMIEEGETKVAAVSMLPFFGSANTTDEGYYFIPDGSGALIEFNDKSVNTSDYENTQYFSNCFGEDFMFLGGRYIYKMQAPTVPVIGINRKEGGMTMVVDKGSAYASVSSCVSTDLRPINYLYFECNLRYADMLVAGGYNNADKNFRKNKGKISSQTFGVRYYPTTPDKNTYNDMADIYRNYLIEEHGMKPLAENSVSPLFVDTLGSIKVPKNFLGIPYTGLDEITTYNQASEMIDEIKKNGFENIVFRYQGWQKGGMSDVVPSKVKAAGNLGGKKDLKALIDKDKKDENLKIFFDADLIDLYKEGNGCLIITDAAKAVDSMPTVEGTYRRSTKMFNGLYAWYMLYPPKALEMSNKFIKSAKDFGITSLSLNDVGNKLYTSFNGGSSFDRNACENTFKKMVDNAKAAMPDGVLVENGNINVSVNADYIMDLPLESSKLDIAKIEIPFLQMVLRGYKYLAGDAYNHQANKSHHLLKTAETGVSLNLSLFAADAEAVKNDERFNTKFADNIDDNIEIIKQTAEKLNPLYKALGNSYITRFDILADDINQTTFSNGIKVIVNYTDKDYKAADGTVIKANDFEMVGAAK